MSLKMFIAQNKSGKIPPFANTYIEEYGALYNRYCLDGIATDGWRVPESRDLLRDYLGDVANELKSERTEPAPEGETDVGIATDEHPRWDYHDSAYGTDKYKFNGLPSSHRHENGDFSGALGIIGERLLIHTTEIVFDEYTAIHIRYDSTAIWRHRFDTQKRGFAIRVIRDATANEQDSEHVDFIAEETIIPNEYTGHDGKKYDAVRIGEQVWITENLKETKRMVGEDIVDIPIVTDDTEWSELETAAMCAYPK